MSTFSFEIPIRCEGEIQNGHIPPDKIQEWLHKFIDTKLAENDHNCQNLKINVFRDGDVTLNKKLEYTQSLRPEEGKRIHYYPDGQHSICGIGGTPVRVAETCYSG